MARKTNAQLEAELAELKAQVQREAMDAVAGTDPRPLPVLGVSRFVAGARRVWGAIATGGRLALRYWKLIAIAAGAALVFHEVDVSTAEEIAQQHEHLGVFALAAVLFGVVKVVLCGSLLAKWFWLDEMADDHPTLDPKDRILAASLLSAGLSIGLGLDAVAVAIFMT